MVCGAKSADVLLSDGIDRPRATDPARGRRPAIVALHSRFSERTRYLRYFSPYPRIPQRDLDRFVNVDHRDREAFVVEPAGELIAVGRYERLGAGLARGRGRVRGRGRPPGPGHRLGAARAPRRGGPQERHHPVRGRGAAGRTAAMLRVFSDAGYQVERKYADGVVHLSVPDRADHRDSLRGAVGPRAAHRGALDRPAAQPARASPSTAPAPTAPGVGAAMLAPPARRRLHRRRSCRCTRSADRVGRAARLPLGGGTPAPGGPGGGRGAAGRASPRPWPTRPRPGVHGLRGRLRRLRRGRRRPAPRRSATLLGAARARGPAPGRARTAWASPTPTRRYGSTPPSRRSCRRPGPGRLLQPVRPRSGMALLAEADRRGLGLSSFVSAGNRADVSGNDLLQYWRDDPRHRRGAALPGDVRQPAQVRPASPGELGRRKPVVAVAAADPPAAARRRPARPGRPRRSPRCSPAPA